MDRIPIVGYGRRKRPWLKWLKVLLALVVIATVVAAGISVFVGWKLTHPARTPVTESPSRVGLDFEDVQFKSAEDGILLRGWWIPAPDSHGTIVFAHGYKDNRLIDKAGGLSLARLFVDNGFNVLMFDFRNSGASEGRLTSVGQLEVNDLLGAIDYARGKEASSSIGIIGFSMGASTALDGAAIDQGIDAVVADSPFADLSGYLRSNLPIWTGLPAFPFTPIFMTSALGNSLPPPWRAFSCS